MGICSPEISLVPRLASRFRRLNDSVLNRHGKKPSTSISLFRFNQISGATFWSNEAPRQHMRQFHYFEMNNGQPYLSQTTIPYQPLDPNIGEIRLIEVQPLKANEFGTDGSSYGSQSVVSCHLKHASLNQWHCYTALSYAWGDPKVTSQILIDGQPVQVTTNLESALRHLATQPWDNEDSGLSVWVDAVCINQQDEAERAQQVSQMKEIFTHASQTAIWLGPASGDSALAIDTMHTMSKTANLESFLFPSWSTFPFAETASHPVVTEVQNILDQVLTGLCLHDSARLKSITSLFERPWFSRVWVIQERVLSSNCIVCCGNDWMSWNKFFEGFWLLCGLRDYLNIIGSGTGRRDSSALASSLTTALDRVTPVAFTQPASPLLILFSLLSRMAIKAQLQASDRRDYVFSLLGLIDSHQSPSILVNYTKDWLTVQTEVAEACLTYYGPVILSFAGTPQYAESHILTMQNAPSWAPDWSSKQLPQPLHIPSVFIVRGCNRERAYSASASFTQNLSGAFSVDRSLSLWSFLLDDVSAVGKPFSEVEDYADDTARVNSVASWLQDFDTILPCPNGIYKTPEEVTEALWRTPIADRAFPYNWETERASKQVFSAYKALKEGDPSKGIKYSNIASIKLYRRRPFRSAKGYIGIGPLAMCEGDLVWIVPGADIPFIFRRARNGNFLVIGEAYVHGIMDGELHYLLRSIGLQRIKLI